MFDKSPARVLLSVLGLVFVGLALLGLREVYAYYQLTHPPAEALKAFKYDLGREGLYEAPEKTATRYKKLCDQGYSPACEAGAWASLPGPQLRLQKAAITLSSRAEAGDPLAQTVRAWALFENLWPGEQLNLIELKWLEAPCEADYAAGCISIAKVYQLGAGLTESSSKAADLFQKACEGGDGEGCVELSRLLKDTEAAEKLLQKACELQSLQGCTMLAKGKAQEKEVLAQACLGGLVEACKGEELIGAWSLGASQYKSACDMGELVACQLLGTLLLSGNGVPKNPQAAAAVFEKTCNSGFFMACASLGEIHDKGVLGSQSPILAARLYEQAVDGGVRLMVPYRLGEMHRLSRGVVQDNEKEARYFQLGCDSLIGRSCYNLAIMQIEGRGVLKSMEKAQYNFQLACSLGVENACGVSLPME
jgi:TPR repeat protein